MKKVYWRPGRVSRVELSLISLLAIGGLVAVEVFPSIKKQPHFTQKRAAAVLALEAFDSIREERLYRNIPISEDGDPLNSGVIGDLISPIVTNTGHLPAKQTSINPNFAALVVHYLKRAGVQEGDVVAVGVSGSFPAINIAVYSAMETLRLRPIIISSTSASQWGASHPDFTWLDMEKYLFMQKIFSFRSAAVSRGGIDDRALGLPRDSKLLLDIAMDRSELPQLRPKNYEDSVKKRIAIYQEQSGEDPIMAYLNVGGGTSSVGTRVGKRLFKPGLNTRPPPGRQGLDSVMLHFSNRDVPVIHMVRIMEQAERYGFPLLPETMPAVGQGKIFARVQYNTTTVIIVLLVLLGSLFAFVRYNLGMRLKSSLQQGGKSGPPKQMV